MAWFRVTGAFYNLAVYTCQEAPVWEAIRKLRISRTPADKIKNHAYNRAKEARSGLPRVRRLAIDETGFHKHHDYVTVLTDADSGTVVDVLSDRTAETLKEWFAAQRVAYFSELRSICMDMAPPYIKAVWDSFPNADQILYFDWFHVA